MLTSLLLRLVETYMTDSATRSLHEHKHMTLLEHSNEPCTEGEVMLTHTDALSIWGLVPCSRVTQKMSWHWQAVGILASNRGSRTLKYY